MYRLDREKDLSWVTEFSEKSVETGKAYQIAVAEIGRAHV